MASTLLQSTPAQGGADMSFFIMLGAMMLIMYFFMIRPQMKRQKEARKFREGLNKGDKVVTIGGVHGRVAEIEGSTVVLLVESGKIRVELNAINPSGTVSEQDLQQNR
jgi:preprotein translocase subunit YajC